MTIELKPDVKKQLIASIRRFFDEKLELDIGDLKAGFVLDFALREIAPSVYNQAVADAQGYLAERVADLEASCFEREFAFWEDRTRR